MRINCRSLIQLRSHGFRRAELCRALPHVVPALSFQPQLCIPPTEFLLMNCSSHPGSAACPDRTHLCHTHLTPSCQPPYRAALSGRARCASNISEMNIRELLPQMSQASCRWRPFFRRQRLQLFYNKYMQQLPGSTANNPDNRAY